MSNKRDRQGVRTPAQLEQKYSFGSDQKAVIEMRQLNAQFTRTVTDMRAQMVRNAEELEAMQKTIAEMRSNLSALTQEYVLVPLIQTSGVWAVGGKTYAEIKALLDVGRCVTLYADYTDGTRRYYHPMGHNTTGLTFQYGDGTTAVRAFIGMDGTVTITEGA